MFASEKTWGDEKKTISGRVLLRIIYERYAIDLKSRGTYYTFKDVMNCKAGHDLEEFLQRWDATLYYCWIEPPAELIHHCFFEQIRYFKELKRKIRYYEDDIEEDHADHTYEWLRKIAKQAIEKKRQKRNANERSSS